MHCIYYNLTYWPCLKTWQSLLPCQPIASKLCISVRVKIQAFSIYMRFSQKDHGRGNLCKAVHLEGACDGPVWPKHPWLSTNTANTLNRLWWHYLEPKQKPGYILCQTTDQPCCCLESMADIRLWAAPWGSPNHQQESGYAAFFKTFLWLSWEHGICQVSSTARMVLSPCCHYMCFSTIPEASLLLSCKLSVWRTILWRGCRHQNTF